MMRLGAFALVLAAAGAAQAEPGGTSGVSSPTVTRGDSKLEFRAAAFEGDALDGAWGYRAQASHAFTDWWRPTLVLRASQPDGESAELTSVGLENVFDFTPTRDWPVHLGAQFEYKLGLNRADDKVELKLLAERRRGPFAARLNLIAERAVDGDSDAWTHAYAGRAMWRASDAVSLGFEAFGEPDASAHYVGPRAGMRIGQTTLSLAYLVGIDDAQADGQFRLALEFEP
jgi:hypothetical protein